MALVLGLDVGDRRIGTALADDAIRIATPHATFNRAQGRAEEAILQLVTERGLVRIVAGLPLNEDGTRSEQCLKVENFCRRLQRRLNIEVIFVDEYLSSFESEELLRTASPRRRSGRNRAERERGAVDAVSAQVILERYFSQMGVGPG